MLVQIPGNYICLSLYKCKCEDGYTGKNCEYNIDECKFNECLNGGICQDRVNDFYCQCKDGYKGKNCQDDIDECLSYPCQNGGFCTNQKGSYLCNCPHEYTGKNCHIKNSLYGTCKKNLNNVSRYTVLAR